MNPNTNNEKNLDFQYWDNRYKDNEIGWDLGEASPPIKSYFDKITQKQASILIPGCGNTYEAEYLLSIGFTNITVIDIAPTLVSRLKKKFKNITSIKVLLGDFFELQGNYDYIIEQTFFCALAPSLRQKYRNKVHKLLTPGGILIGLLFNKQFENSPPFGGTDREYRELFATHFNFLAFESCKNSIAPRANTELFIELQKIN
jgi:SAM-dependent methyltransferase